MSAFICNNPLKVSFCAYVKIMTCFVYILYHTGYPHFSSCIQPGVVKNVRSIEMTPYPNEYNMNSSLILL